MQMSNKKIDLFGNYLWQKEGTKENKVAICNAYVLCQKRQLDNKDKRLRNWTVVWYYVEARVCVIPVDN